MTHRLTHTAVRQITLGSGLAALALATAGILAAQAAQAGPKTDRSELTRACMASVADARVDAKSKRAYCGCVTARFMAARRNGDLTNARLRKITRIWRGEAKWSSAPTPFSEFDYHTRSRCGRTHGV